MFPFQVNDLILIMAVVMLGLGIISIGAGIIILFFRAGNGEVKVIAQQTSKLAQKGIAEDVAGLVGNASSLIEALNQMVRTASGVGIFLILAGFIFCASAYFLVSKIM